MRKLLVLTISLMITISGFGKNIIDIFYLIPSKSILNKNIEQRKKLVDFYLSETIQIPENERHPSSPEKLIKTIDINNGFMEIYDGSEGSIEICYWNINNKEKLIAINYVACSTFEGTVKLTFYKLESDDKLVELDTDTVVPYKDIHRKLLKIGLSESIIRIITKDGLLSTENIIMDLPRNGKDIKVKFGWDEIDNRTSIIANNRCLLVWENYNLRIKD